MATPIHGITRGVIRDSATGGAPRLDEIWDAIRVDVARWVNKASGASGAGYALLRARMMRK